MRGKALFILACTLPLLLAGSEGRAQSGPETIIIGSVSLRLGMSHAEVVSTLSPQYDLVRLPETEDAWYVQHRGSAPVVGCQLHFRNAELTAISCTAGPADPADKEAGVPFAQALYGVIAKFIQENHTACSLLTKEKQESWGEVKNVHIVCGPKRITITILQGQAGGRAWISEVLEQR